MDLLVVQLKAAIRRLLDSKGVRARVLDKVNRYGEVVIGVILEKPAPPVHVALPDVPSRGDGDEQRDGQHREERAEREGDARGDLVRRAGEGVAPAAGRER